MAEKEEDIKRIPPPPSSSPSTPLPQEKADDSGLPPPRIEKWDDFQ